MDLKNPTRTESLLANIAGYTGVPVPDMKNATRSERLLKEILDNGGGGGGDVTKEYVDTAIADAVADIDDDISALSDTVADKVDKENGKGLSTNDYTDADKGLVQDSPITVTATGTDLALSTSSGALNTLTVFGKSEVVDGEIKSAGEGYAVVRLANLTWAITSNRFYTQDIKATVKKPVSYGKKANAVCSKYITVSASNSGTANNSIAIDPTGDMLIHDETYTTVSDFVASLGNVTLCYQLADPTQGNTIAIKTDDGTGIAGTMAVFETGTPLYGVSDTVRDVMTWDGSAGTVTKNCAKVRLADLTWGLTNRYSRFYTNINLSPMYHEIGIGENPQAICNKYNPDTTNNVYNGIDKTIGFGVPGVYQNRILVCDKQYTTVEDFVASLGDAELVYELDNPTTEQLTSTENDSIAGLRTFAPQTHAQNNAGATMTVEAYANTANGQLISDMQPTRSPLLTLSASGWTNNTQTVTYEHDTGKRNSIDVEPTSIKAWTAAGILATTETASTITFECDTAPTADLSFRVTSMEVR